MLSLSNVESGAAAATYYEAADDYYTGDRSPSAWWGRGAEALGLAGEVEPEVFARLLDGRLPTGEQLHHAAAGRRGGTDATFSAPKSVSLQALVGGDLRLLDAHTRAVDRALAYAQTLAACRVTEAGQTVTAPTGNLLVARFEHDLSRACDPQLHTHCVMVNATRRADGQWRALSNEALYRQKMYVDLSGFEFEKFFPPEFAGKNMLTRALLWIVPFAGNAVRQRGERLPLTLDMVDRAIRSKRWERGIANP